MVKLDSYLEIDAIAGSNIAKTSIGNVGAGNRAFPKSFIFKHLHGRGGGI